MAQLGARLDGIEEVVGSNPIGSTNFLKPHPQIGDDSTRSATMLATAELDFDSDPNESSPLKSRIERDGYAVVPSCLDNETVNRLSAEFDAAAVPRRNLLAVPIVRTLAKSHAVRCLAEEILGSECFAIKATFFNKTAESNWKVAWHQDLTIAVRERKEVAGFGPWTVKGEIPHVQPPAEILSRVLAIRVHLDANDKDNGPIRVLPGSHKHGRFTVEHLATYPKSGIAVCTVPRGGALLMRPLLLHASSACTALKPRRVIHIEFAAEELPNGLRWFDTV